MCDHIPEVCDHSILQTACGIFIKFVLGASRLGVFETWVLVSRRLETRFYKSWSRSRSWTSESWSWSWSWNLRVLVLGLGLGTLESRSQSWYWYLGPWRLGGLHHSWSVKLKQNRKSNYGFVWLDADLPENDGIMKTVYDTITNAIIFEAEQCCSTAELETASQSACALWAVHQWGKYSWSPTIETVPIFTVCFLWET